MIVGLTGGICSGKTEAALVLACMGVRVIDADEISRFLTHYDSDVLLQIEKRFGAEIFTEYGALDRTRLGNLVFSDGNARADLESVLHPPIIALQRENILAARAAGRPLVISAPLLIESGAYRDVDHVVLVSCTTERQQQRLMKRNGLDSAEASARISTQLPLETKQKHAQTVLDNNGTLAEFQAKVRELFTSLFVQEPHV